MLLDTNFRMIYFVLNIGLSQPIHHQILRFCRHSKNKDVIIFRYMNDTKFDYKTGNETVKSIKYDLRRTVEENKLELYRELRKCQKENGRYPSVKAICSTYGK